MVIRYNRTALNNERIVAKAIEKAWNVSVVRGNFLDHADFALEYEGKIIGYAETKARTHNFGTYPTLYLSVRKWKALTSTGLPGYFIVKFLDSIRVVQMQDVDATRIISAGRTDRTNAPNDIEPMIEVPIQQLKLLEELKIV